MYRAAVIIRKISPDRMNRLLGRPIQVNGAFYSIKKSRVIKIFKSGSAQEAILVSDVKNTKVTCG